MHVVHLANTTKNGIIASAMGVIFDVDEYDKSVTPEQVEIIDNFFKSLKLNLTEPTTGKIPFGDLMEMLDTSNRWAYKGSLTTPPCSKTVFFNILNKVYPIKQEHLDMYKQQLEQAPDVKAKGNYRVIQPIDTQDPKLITNWNIEET